MTTLDNLHRWLDAHYPHHRDLGDDAWDALVAEWTALGCPDVEPQHRPAPQYPEPVDYVEVERLLHSIGHAAGGPRVRRRLAGVNVLTADVVGTWQVAEHLVELSYGRGMAGGWLYGVSVRHVDTGADEGHSACHHDMDSVFHHLRRLAGYV